MRGFEEFAWETGRCEQNPQYHPTMNCDNGELKWRRSLQSAVAMTPQPFEHILIESFSDRVLRHATPWILPDI